MARGFSSSTALTLRPMSDKPDKVGVDGASGTIPGFVRICSGPYHAVAEVCRGVRDDGVLALYLQTTPVEAGGAAEDVRFAPALVRHVEFVLHLSMLRGRPPVADPNGALGTTRPEPSGGPSIFNRAL
jgi:hypothetical protein